jgi:uncharacterized YigZ family protein
VELKVAKSMNEQTYLTIANDASCEMNIERSRFIAHCRETSSEESAKSFIEAIKAQHCQATHNCYAYRIQSGEFPLEYFNDHGEPSGTAGKPILGAILRLNLTNVTVVVTRYFGGKKLGVRGLIEAYGKTASLALEQAGTILKIPHYFITLSYSYHDHSMVVYQLKQVEAKNIVTEFGESVQTTFQIPLPNYPVLQNFLKESPHIKVVIHPVPAATE